MFRSVENDLIEWKDQINRKPLLIRGARQVGKSFVVENFGKNHFQQFIIINFELEPRYIGCFESLDPSRIIRAIEAIAQQDIHPGSTLLFLDEIQYSPKAILSLRYFKEQMPTLHIIGAGSFLEFIINDAAYQQPVGRVQSLYMKPCSLQEYLIASGHQRLVDYMKTVSLTEGFEPSIHDLLLEKTREYFILGGMPEAIQYFLSTGKYLGCEKIQASILEYYQRDLAKYQEKINVRALQKIFMKAPGLVGKHFRYVDIDPDIQARDQKPAVEALIKSGVIYPVYQTTANGLPLHVGINEKRFKLIFLDVGLVNHATGLNMDTLLHEDLTLLNKGDVAEQFVAQELLAYGRNYEPQQLFYWEREKLGSQAEVDYVIHVGPVIFPVEVKAGKTGRLKSLQLFLDEKKLNMGIRISQNELSFINRVLTVPIYMIHELPRLLQKI